jgi:flavin reductase (DIM6/NTAB) family NADH-FMN oxidoreductase RutF
VAGTELRRALGLFATGVTVVAAIDPATGRPRGITANAFMSGSLHPPLIVVALRRQARAHGAVARAGAYGVSVLPESLEHEARRFAGLPVGDHEPGPRFAVRASAPVLAGALAWFAARVAGRHEVGDHTLFVGEVIDFGSHDPDAPALAYHRSAFARVVAADERPPLPIDAWGGALDLWG